MYPEMRNLAEGSIKDFSKSCAGIASADDPKAAWEGYVEAVTALAQSIGGIYLGAWGRLKIAWFDHRFDWLRNPGYWNWHERSVFGMRYIREGDRVLDLCCGDGFYAGEVFSEKAAFVHAVDWNGQALAVANKVHKRGNVEFFRMDVKSDAFPLDRYDVVLFFEALEHFGVEGGTTVLRKIAGCLANSPDGTLLGSTPIVSQPGSNPEHDNEFYSVAQLRDFLEPHFRSVEIWTSEWPGGRDEAYFLCKP